MRSLREESAEQWSGNTNKEAGRRGVGPRERADVREGQGEPGSSGSRAFPKGRWSQQRGDGEQGKDIPVAAPGLANGREEATDQNWGSRKGSWLK